MITKDELRKHVLELKEIWVDTDFEQNLDVILELGVVDFDNEEPNLKPAYPILCAILQRTINYATYGSSYESTIKDCKRKIKRYLNTAFWLKKSFLDHKKWVITNTMRCEPETTWYYTDEGTWSDDIKRALVCDYTGASGQAACIPLPTALKCIS